MILVFGLGVLCGMVFQTLLIFLYASLRSNDENNIDKN